MHTAKQMSVPPHNKTWIEPAVGETRGGAAGERAGGAVVRAVDETRGGAVGETRGGPGGETQKTKKPQQPGQEL